MKHINAHFNITFEMNFYRFFFYIHGLNTAHNVSALWHLYIFEKVTPSEGIWRVALIFKSILRVKPSTAHPLPSRDVSHPLLPPHVFRHSCLPHTPFELLPEMAAYACDSSGPLLRHGSLSPRCLSSAQWFKQLRATMVWPSGNPGDIKPSTSTGVVSHI